MTAQKGQGGSFDKGGQCSSNPASQGLACSEHSPLVKETRCEHAGASLNMLAEFSLSCVGSLVSG